MKPARRSAGDPSRLNRVASRFHRGYCVLDLKPDRIQNDWYFVPTVEERTDEQRWAVGIRVAAGTQRGVCADGPA